jgi:hypothetical protein
VLSITKCRPTHNRCRLFKREKSRVYYLIITLRDARIQIQQNLSVPKDTVVGLFIQILPERNREREGLFRIHPRSRGKYMKEAPPAAFDYLFNVF